MFAGLLQDALASTSPTVITEIAIYMMAGLLFVGLYCGFKSQLPRLTAQVPTLLTSCGILGTFAGIVIGLHDFSAEAERIDASIGVLLGGLDIAFTSSLVGMFFAILFKLFETRFPLSDDLLEDAVDPVLVIARSTQETLNEVRGLKQALAGASDDSIIEQLFTQTALLAELRNGNEKARKTAAQQAGHLSALERALVEDDDTGITGQLRNLQRELIKSRREERSANEKADASRAEQVQKLELVLSEIRNATEASRQSADSLLSLVDDTSSKLSTHHQEQSRLNNEANESLSNIRHELSERGQVVLRLDKINSSVGKLEQVQRDGVLTVSDTLKNQVELQMDMASLMKGGLDASEQRHAQFSRDIEDIADQLSQQVAIQKEMGVRVFSLLSLQTQVREELEESLGKMVALLSRSPTEEIIDALKSTIREFNDHISEQFGDNFARLNDAVGDLLTWQDTHRQHLAEMIQQYERSIKAVESTERSIGHIAEHGEAIPKQMTSLGHIMESNKAQLSDINKHLNSFADVRDRAVEAVPQISEIVDTTVKQLLETSQSITVGVHQSVEEMTSGISQSASRHVEAMQSVEADVRAITQRTREESQRLFENLEATIRDSYRAAAEQTEKLVTKEFTDMESVRTKQVENIMNEMGVALGTITRTFTEDYTKLVSAMDKVVQQGLDRKGVA